MKKPLCIYHANCADGFAAAWVVRHSFGPGNVEFLAANYGDPPPDVTDREVYIVDFSYKRAVLEAMFKTCASLTVLDHHKSAQEDLVGLFPIEPRAKIIFDMHRSGAMITWDYFFPLMNPPILLEHIQDRDLWLFKLDGTRDVHASVVSYPYDFEIWDRLIVMPTRMLRTSGEAIDRKHRKDVAELVGVAKRSMMVGGVTVPVANLPYTLASDAGNLMAQGFPFAATYMDTPKGRVFSLRSNKETGIDVSLIAKIYGGGGHKNAAGFTVPIGWEGD